MKAYGGDVVKLKDGTRGKIVATRHSLVGAELQYDLEYPGTRTAKERVNASEVVEIVSFGRHDYWAPDKDGKRGYCKRCGVKKSAHEVLVRR